MVEPTPSNLSLQQLKVLSNLRKSALRFELFGFTNQTDCLDKIQFLNRFMYYVKVPLILYRVHFFMSKFPPQFKFIDILRNADFKTHQYNQIVHSMLGLTGKLDGEFFKNTNLPDGRCRFVTDNKNTQILCYYKNGVLQKGPRLHCDRKAEIVVIRSNTNAF